MLDYKLLEALSTVVLEGGFEKAARVLFIIPSAVSQRIKTLEEQTGQVLLVRANPPKATEAGLRLMKHRLQVKRLEGDLFGGSGFGGKGPCASVLALLEYSLSVARRLTECLIAGARTLLHPGG